MLLLLFVGFLTVFLFHQLYWRRRNLPPGPFPLPIFGNIFQIDNDNLAEQLLAWKKEYGNVFTIWIPSANVIVSDSENFKEFIKHGDAYAGRPQLRLAEISTGANYGLVFNSNSIWKSQKRFALHMLRDFGFGKPILEDTIIDQARQIQEFLKNLNGEPVDMTTILTTAVGNIVHQLTFGYTVPIESSQIIDIRNMMMENGSFFMSPLGLLIELWPGFRHLDPIFGYAYKKSRELDRKVEEFGIREIKKHRETINFDGEPRDYIDAFLIEQRKQKFEGIKHGEWSDNQLIGSVLDLFGAGTETTATTIRTFILYMIHHPDLQDMLFKEINTVIGNDRSITMNDQQSLPFLQACIQEIQRILVLVKMNIQHVTLDDVHLDGYDIPKNTYIVAQFQSVHLDENCFENPKKFDPFRHLKDGKFFKNELITPFSIGKRSCLGEGLAKMELFLFIGNIFQKFEFLPEIDGELPPIKFEKRMIGAPLAFKNRVVLRKQL